MASVGLCISSRRGFSLVELSIVLVILGLLVGGVLSGQALIKAATLRKQLNQITTIQTGMNTFRDKYFSFPGDLPNATSFFGTTDPAGQPIDNGNGDGVIKSNVCMSGYPCDCIDVWPDQIHSGGSGYEGVYFFQELLLAGLFSYTPGTGHEQWPHAVANNANHIMVSCTMATGPTPMTIVPADRRFLSPVMFIAWDAGDPDSLYGFANAAPTSGVDNDDARQIDAKMDDSLPSTGSVWSVGGCAKGLSTYMSATCQYDILAVKMN